MLEKVFSCGSLSTIFKKHSHALQSLVVPLPNGNDNTAVPRGVGLTL